MSRKNPRGTAHTPKRPSLHASRKKQIKLVLLTNSVYFDNSNRCDGRTSLCRWFAWTSLARRSTPSQCLRTGSVVGRLLHSYKGVPIRAATPARPTPAFLHTDRFYSSNKYAGPLDLPLTSVKQEAVNSPQLSLRTGRLFYSLFQVLSPGGYGSANANPVCRAFLPRQTFQCRGNLRSRASARSCLS